MKRGPAQTDPRLLEVFGVPRFELGTSCSLSRSSAEEKARKHWLHFFVKFRGAGFGAGWPAYLGSRTLLFDDPQALVLVRVVQDLNGRPERLGAEVGVTVSCFAGLMAENTGEVPATLTCAGHPGGEGPAEVVNSKPLDTSFLEGRFPDTVVPVVRVYVVFSGGVREYPKTFAPVSVAPL